MRTHAGTWLRVSDDSRIAYQVDEEGHSVEFSFLGPVELGVEMSEQSVRRCHEMFGEVLAEMGRLQESVDQSG
jgi:hypothetical protein